MYKIELDMEEIEDISDIMQLEEENDEIDIITEKNFTGDITTVEIFIGVLEVLIPVVRSLIKNKKISSMKLDGDKIEIKNVSEELVEKILTEKYKNNSNTEE